MVDKEIRIVVIVPCFNEKPYLEECIRAIYNNRFSQSVSVSVSSVDGMRNDGTRELINELKKEFSQLERIDNPSRFTPFAFNLGIQSKKADYYQIVGARHILSPNYLEMELQTLKNDSAAWCVGGRIINEFLNPTGEIIANAMGTTFGMGLGNFRTLKKSGYTDTVTSPMYPAWVFDKIGYFDENLVRNQDDDFNYRVAQNGGKIVYLHEIYLKYYVRGNFKNLFKQFFQYGYWKVFVNRKHRAVTTIRQLVPPLFVLYLFASIFLSLFFPSLTIVFCFPLIIYGFLNILFSIKCSNKINAFILTLGTFPLLHIAYGTGYLKGVFQFLVLNKKPSAREKSISR
jgi:GT2 family glycosyltransferase